MHGLPSDPAAANAPLPSVLGETHRPPEREGPEVTTEERWEHMVGTGGAYRVSDLGPIRGVERRARTNNGSGESTRRVPAHLMSPVLRNGRATVRICVDGQPRTVLVSTAVLEAFRGPRPRGYLASHLNGDPTDCRLCNLRWVRRGQAAS